MERLTTKSDKGGLAFTFDLDITCEKTEIEKIIKLGKKLKEYEDLEEQGLLIKLPCNVGTTVFVADDGYNVVEERTIKRIVIMGDWMKCELNYQHGSDIIWFNPDEIGTFAFFTREEAEKRLAELEGGAEE